MPILYIFESLLHENSERTSTLEFYPADGANSTARLSAPVDAVTTIVMWNFEIDEVDKEIRLNDMFSWKKIGVPQLVCGRVDSARYLASVSVRTSYVK